MFGVKLSAEIYDSVFREKNHFLIGSLQFVTKEALNAFLFVKDS